jgi:UDP-N-acetyl-D-glucosamine dehydrogenase
MQGRVYGTVAVIGQGYVGLPLAVEAAEAGWVVTGIDKSSKIVESLSAGHSHIEDVEDSKLSRLLKSGHYRATNRFEEVSEASVCVICVPTPLDDFGSPDTSLLESAVKSVAPHLTSGTLLVNESTSYPGTLRDLIRAIVNDNRESGIDGIGFASAPERIDPQNKEWKLSSTPRLISGIDSESRNAAQDFYATFCRSVVPVSSPEVAELAKLLENTFRQVNIALVNQLVPLCHKIGVDIREVIEAAGTKPYGFMKFYPGAGVGGHCIPVDPMYLLWKSRQLGIDLPFIEKADDVNGKMPEYVVERLLHSSKDRESRNILLVGVAYKPGVADVRESPALDVADELKSRGFRVLYSDPLVGNFDGLDAYSGEDLRGAIVITAQPGIQLSQLLDAGVPILDCTGTFKDLGNVEQL